MQFGKVCHTVVSCAAKIVLHIYTIIHCNTFLVIMFFSLEASLFRYFIIGKKNEQVEEVYQSHSPTQANKF